MQLLERIPGEDEVKRTSPTETEDIGSFPSERVKSVANWSPLQLYPPENRGGTLHFCTTPLSFADNPEALILSP